MTPVLQVVHRVITRYLLGQAGLKVDETDSGAVTLIQRFGSAANLNIHLHCLVLDGVYRRGIDGAPKFVEVPEPTDEALQSVLHKIITRLMRLLTRRGVLVEEEGSTYVADNDGDSDEARVLRPLQAAACSYRIAFGPRAGQKVLTLQGGLQGMPRDADFKQRLCADIDGFSLHVWAPTTTRRCSNCAATSRARRWPTNACKPTPPGRWCSSSRPPGATAPRITTHLVMSPLAFMQRLAALVPRPRLHLIRFHGVLAPHAKLRALVVPQEPEPPAQEAKPEECEAGCAHHRPVRLSGAKLLKRVFAAT
ncbi:MAG: transposase [Bacteriovorax sp.]|nr:transposase [Rhizobacter sp.]